MHRAASSTKTPRWLLGLMIMSLAALLIGYTISPAKTTMRDASVVGSNDPGDHALLPPTPATTTELLSTTHYLMAETTTQVLTTDPLPVPGAFGTGWQAQWAVIHQNFPDATLTSSQRCTDTGFHCSGQAIDIGASASRMKEIDAWIAANYPESKELIHTPGPFNLYDGVAHVYSAATQGDHYDHVHWAMIGPV